MLVADASLIALVVADGGPDGQRVRRRLRNESIAAPDLLRIEVISVIRRHCSIAELTQAEADQAVADLLALPVTIYPTGPLLQRCWDLRDNLTAYDACYVALAEALACPLLTVNARLGRAPGTRCTIEVP